MVARGVSSEMPFTRLYCVSVPYHSYIPSTQDSETYNCCQTECYAEQTTKIGLISVVKCACRQVILYAVRLFRFGLIHVE